MLVVILGPMVEKGAYMKATAEHLREQAVNYMWIVVQLAEVGESLGLELVPEVVKNTLDFYLELLLLDGRAHDSIRKLIEGDLLGPGHIWERCYLYIFSPELCYRLD